MENSNREEKVATVRVEMKGYKKYKKRLKNLRKQMKKLNKTKE